MISFDDSHPVRVVSTCFNSKHFVLMPYTTAWHGKQFLMPCYMEFEIHKWKAILYQFSVLEVYPSVPMEISLELKYVIQQDFVVVVVVPTQLSPGVSKTLQRKSDIHFFTTYCQYYIHIVLRYTTLENHFHVGHYFKY